MSDSYSWARGPLEWDDAANSRGRVAEIGRAAELQTSARMAHEGWIIGIPSGGADIVATDPGSNRQVRIEVKVARPERKRKRLFVANPKLDVDAHVFVALEDTGSSRFWVVPDEVVKSRSRGGVLQEQDVDRYRDAWHVLRAKRSL